MNDFSELESQLKKLRPAAVSPELLSRVEQAIMTPAFEVIDGGGIAAERASRRTHWWPVGLGLAAAAAFMLLARPSVDRKEKWTPTVAAQTKQPAGAFVPSGMTQVVYNTRDEGLHFTAKSSVPVRRVRSQRRETIQWQNPQTGARLQVSYPAEEVTLTPAGGQ